MQLKINIDKADKIINAQIIGNELWVHYNGRTFVTPAGTGTKSRKKGLTASSDTILSPMPGKITKILIQEGDTVKPGQAVLVMEAMKMEYTLKAEVEGTIEKLNCSLGEQATLGSLLVKIKPQVAG